MKRLILLFIIFCNIVVLNNLIGQEPIDEDSDSLVLLLLDENDENYLATIALSSLKKCTFPAGPMRNNDVLRNQFTQIPPEIVARIKSSMENKDFLELSLFCIDSESMGVKCKTCSFSIPGKGDLCYVFKFERDLKETRAAILTYEQLNDLLIDIATSNAESNAPLPEIQAKPNSKIKNFMTGLLINIFINSLDIYEQGKQSCKNLVDFLKRLKFS